MVQTARVLTSDAGRVTLDARKGDWLDEVARIPD
jgi:hypothetical protein